MSSWLFQRLSGALRTECVIRAFLCVASLCSLQRPICWTPASQAWRLRIKGLAALSGLRHEPRYKPYPPGIGGHPGPASRMHLGGEGRPERKVRACVQNGGGCCANVCCANVCFRDEEEPWVPGSSHRVAGFLGSSLEQQQENVSEGSATEPNPASSHGVCVRVFPASLHTL